jgi:hypothetical protein
VELDVRLRIPGPAVKVKVFALELAEGTTLPVPSVGLKTEVLEPKVEVPSIDPMLMLSVFAMLELSCEGLAEYSLLEGWYDECVDDLVLDLDIVDALLKLLEEWTLDLE